MSPAVLAASTVTWIKVDKPTFDLVGVVLSSLGIAGICAAVALTLGIALGVSFIVRVRRGQGPSETGVSLHLLEPRS